MARSVLGATSCQGTLSALIVTQFLDKMATIVSELPPHSPYLAPCDQFLFYRLKKKLKRCHFQILDNVKRSTSLLLSELTKDQYCGSFAALKIPMKKFVKSKGEYFEGYM